MIGRETLHATSLHPHVLPAQNSQKERRMTKIPRQVETSQGDVTDHRSAVLLGGGTPIPWVTPTAVLLRSYGAFQRRNPPCPASTNSQKERRRCGWIIAGGEVH